MNLNLLKYLKLNCSIIMYERIRLKTYFNYINSTFHLELNGEIYMFIEGLEACLPVQSIELIQLKEKYYMVKNYLSLGISQRKSRLSFW